MTVDAREESFEKYCGWSTTTEMMPVNGAADNLKRLHNAFRLKIHIFTHRPPLAYGLYRMSAPRAGM